MNIFVLDIDVKTCAQFHNNRHTVKMILEYSQLLSTAHRILDGKESVIISDSGRKKKVWKHPDRDFDYHLYSATHINHPCAIWVRQSDSNYRWLSLLLMHLCDEYTFRYGKIHKVERDGLLDLLVNNYPKNIKSGSLTKFALAMPDECKIGSVVESYRSYYITHKNHLAQWNGKVNEQEIPWWYTENQIAHISIS